MEKLKLLDRIRQKRTIGGRGNNPNIVETFLMSI